MSAPVSHGASVRGSLVVVGAGIAGLSAAWYAAADGWQVTVLEAASRVGGKLLSGSLAGVQVDLGAESMLAVRPEGLQLLAEAGLDGARIVPSTTSARIRAGGADHPLPARTMLGIPADLEAPRRSGALSASGIAAVERETELPPLAPLTCDISVGALVRDRMGDEVADRLVEPLLGGVYAGRVDALSLSATIPKLAARLQRGGSLLRAVQEVAGPGTRSPADGPVFTSLVGGIGILPAALVRAGRFDVRTGVTVRAVHRTPTGFALECGAVPVAERLECDAVIVAAPASKAARMLRELVPAASADLAGVESASIAIVSFAFDRAAPAGGSGLLVAAGERMATKAVTLTSQKWPIDTDLTLVRASVGRAGEAHALQFDDAELTELVRRELRPLVGIDAHPVDSTVTRWGGGLPQYAVGHVERVGRIRSAVARVPRLAVCGAAYDGVGIPACVAGARAAVARLGAAGWAEDNGGR